MSEDVASPAGKTTSLAAPPTPAAKDSKSVIEHDAHTPQESNVDNEDSINLTLGEDEEKLLIEEVNIYIFLF
jgi:hypothetical protein